MDVKQSAAVRNLRNAFIDRLFYTLIGSRVSKQSEWSIQLIQFVSVFATGNFHRILSRYL